MIQPLAALADEVAVGVVLHIVGGRPGQLGPTAMGHPCNRAVVAIGPFDCGAVCGERIRRIGVERDTVIHRCRDRPHARVRLSVCLRQGVAVDRDQERHIGALNDFLTRCIDHVGQRRRPGCQVREQAQSVAGKLFGLLAQHVQVEAERLQTLPGGALVVSRYLGEVSLQGRMITIATVVIEDQRAGQRADQVDSGVIYKI